ncbi:MAG TPA: hypothetical protein PK635_02815, partial [Actinomycetota bacterium]|nr:hypothetical protein [Actinomycetota bacterium]
VAFERNLEDALAKVLGATVAEQDNQNDKGGKKQTTPAQDLTRALADADAALRASERALRDGNFTAYGKAQDDLQDAINRAIDAQRRIARSDTGNEVEPLPEASPTPEESPAPDAPLDAGTPAPEPTAAPAADTQPAA